MIEQVAGVVSDRKGALNNMDADEFIPKQIDVGLDYHVTSDGVYYDHPKLGLQRLCSPVKILYQTKDEHGRNYGKLIAFLTPQGEVKEHYFRTADIPSVKKKLIDEGLTVESFGSTTLNGFLNALHSPHWRLTSTSTGWLNKNTNFVLPGYSFGPDNALFTGEKQYNDFKQSGTLEQWRYNVARLARGNSRLLFSMSIGFSAPLLRPLSIEGGGFHLEGESGKGKTTAARMCASIYGHPKHYMLSWKDTANAMEQKAAAHNDCCLIPDELGLADPKTLGPTLYTLANGKGKARYNQKLTPEWHCPFLSTGEVGIELMDKEPQLGQYVRFLTVAAVTGDMGLFDDIHSFKTPKLFADTINDNCAKFHGTAILEFVKQFIEGRKNAEKGAAQIISEFQKRVVSGSTNTLHGRAASRFGSVAAGGELATRMGITGWKEGEAFEACVTCFESWKEYSKTFDPETKHIIRVKDWLVNYETQFYDMRKSTVKRLGHADNYEPELNAIGYRKDNRFLIVRSVFVNDICNGVNYRIVAESLKKFGYLDYQEGRLEKMERTPDFIEGGKEKSSTWFFVVSDKILDY
jgi:putative DNA primase/helicase